MTTYTERRIAVPGSLIERSLRLLLRAFYWLTVRMVMGPPLPVRLQRALLSLLATLVPATAGTRITSRRIGAVELEVVEPLHRRNTAVLLYLHGGGFSLGSPRTHRAITTRLAIETGSCVWVPHYRRAPEAPYPAALDDCLACYQALLAQNIPARDIVVAGDSAGGGLTLTLALRLKALGLPQPAGLMVISPVTGSDMGSASYQRYRHSDPMIRHAFMRQAIAQYGLAGEGCLHQVLRHDLAGLPPLLIHVGTDEVLYDDSVRLAAHARDCQVPVELVIFDGLWHVLHLSAPFLPTAHEALRELARRFSELTR